MAVKDTFKTRIKHDAESDLATDMPLKPLVEGALPISVLDTDHIAPAVQPVDPPAMLLDLAELARLQRVEEYQRRRHLQTRTEFRKVQVATTKANRLAVNARHVRRTMAECIRAEDKQSFANLYNSFHDVCAEQTFVPSVDDITNAQPLQEIEVQSRSFMDALSPESRETLLHFLSELKFDANFMAERIAALSQRDLSSLMPDSGSFRSSESVLGGSQRSTSRSVRPIGFAVDRLLDDLSGASFRIPLEALIFSVTPVPEQGSPALPLDTWATVCARLISGQKHGSERLIPAVFDIASYHSSWPGKDRLEHWLVNTLRDGQFILDQPSRQSFKVRVQGQPDIQGEEKAKVDAFYERAVSSLLDLLGDPAEPSVIPPGAIDLAHAVYRKLAHAPGHQESLPRFLVTRWLFSTLMMELLILPESHGLLNGHYVTDLARQRLLRELAVRSQRTVFDVIYAWKYGQTASAETVSRVRTVLDRLDSATRADSMTSVPIQSTDLTFFAISATDALTLLKAVHPTCRASSLSSDHATLRSGLQSSASSVSGLSLFRTADPTPAPWTFNGINAFGLQPPSGMFPALDTDQVALDTQPDHYQVLADLRTELEEWLAAHMLEDDANWVVLAASTHNKQAYLPDALTWSGDCTDDLVQTSTLSQDNAAALPYSEALEILLHHDDTFNALTLEPGRRSEDDTIEAIEIAFEDQIARCQARSDYVNAHTWLMHAESFSSNVANAGHLAIGKYLNSRTDQLICSKQAAVTLTQQLEEWFVSIRPQLATAIRTASRRFEDYRALRDKMWYTADIRTSSAYDSVRAVASALRVMGKPKRSSLAKHAPPLRHWSTSRITSQNAHLKSEAQILDLLASAPERGGPNKLSGEQVRAVTTWMERSEIQVICNGEERLHKLCMEVRKCVDALTDAGTAESPLRFANMLFDRDRTDPPQPAQRSTGMPQFRAAVHRPDALVLQTSMTPGIDSVSVTSHTLSNASSRDYFDMRSPTLTTRSSTSFWSPAMTEIQSPSSATSVGSYAVRESPQSPRKVTMRPGAEAHNFNDELRANITNLLLGDVGASLFADGCETDRAYWSGLGGELVEQHIQSQNALRTRQDGAQHSKPSHFPRLTSRRQQPFNFEHVFRKIFQTFASTYDPFTKLKQLNDIQSLLPPYMAQRGLPGDKIDHPTITTTGTLNTVSSKLATPGSDISIQGFYTLFCKSTIRPPALFRDLQYIASLVPASVLETSPQGKAFWNAAIAASQLKSEARKMLVETADSIIAYHTNNRGHGRSASTAQQQRDSATFTTPSRTPSAESIAKYSMADAAELLQITAKDGDPAAQRELATLYLTHPELMDLIIAPFARPKDVFRDEAEGKWRRDRDDEKCDPRTMCVAHHWMMRAADGGDALAREFLRQRQEMENLP